MPRLTARPPRFAREGCPGTAGLGSRARAGVAPAVSAYAPVLRTRRSSPLKC